MTSSYTSLLQAYLRHSTEKKKAVEVFVSYLKKHPAKSLLDLGCGTGVFVEAALPYCDTIYAIDQVARLPESLKHTSKIEFKKRNIFDLDFEHTIEVALAAYVLWEIPFERWKTLFQKLRRFLSPSGVLVVIDSYLQTNFDNPFFDFNLNLKMLDDYPDWYDYLDQQNVSYQTFPFESEISAENPTQMYDILRFFFQNTKGEQFYSENKAKILSDLNKKRSQRAVTLKMHHRMDVISLF